MIAQIVSFPKAKRADDPAFRAIERHRAVVAAIKLDADGRGGDISKRGHDRYWFATCTLFATRATTRAGLLALFRYIQKSKVVREALMGSDASLMTLLSSLEASFAGLVLGVPPSSLRSAAIANGALSMPHPDADLLAKAEKLKKLFAQWMILLPACLAKWRKVKKIAGDMRNDQKAYSRRFGRASVRTGHRAAVRSRTALFKKIKALARTMLKAPAHTAEGQMVQGAAALTFDDTFWNDIESGDRCFEASKALWQYAHAAGFSVPAWVRRHAAKHARRTARAA